MVHEGGLRLVRARGRATTFDPRFEVLDGAGRPVTARWPALLERMCVRRFPDATESTDSADRTDRTYRADTTIRSFAPGSRDGAPGPVGARPDCVAALCQAVVEQAA